MTRYTKIRDFHGGRLRGIGASDIPTHAGSGLFGLSGNNLRRIGGLKWK